jgi:hypothetical protein
MPKSEDQIERDLQSLVGSMAIEGVTLDEKQIARCRGILSGELDADEEVEKLFEKYRKKQSNQ